ncbi:MAG: helix-hairpin-helix domain-containing protein [candidate division WOR-3 bacterium]
MDKLKKLKDFFYYYLYPSDSEKKVIYLLIFIILLGDVAKRFFYEKRINLQNQKIEKIDFNLAELEDLVNLPSIGPRLSAKIIDFRNKKGEIKKPEELLEIKGLGEKRLEIIKKYFKFPEEDLK